MSAWPRVRMPWILVVTTGVHQRHSVPTVLIKWTSVMSQGTDLRYLFNSHHNHENKKFPPPF